MNEKATRNTNSAQFASQLHAASRAAALTIEEPIAPAPIRLLLLVEHGLAALRRTWIWISERSKVRRRVRKLRVCETAQLGDKKFIALVQADGQRFLIGGTSGSISLLATLPSRKSSRASSSKKNHFEVLES
jgi:hypothetical protein